MNFNMKNQSLPPCPYAKKECRPGGRHSFFQHSLRVIFFYRWYFCWYSS